MRNKYRNWYRVPVRANRVGTSFSFDATLILYEQEADRAQDPSAPILQDIAKKTSDVLGRL